MIGNTMKSELYKLKPNTANYGPFHGVPFLRRPEKGLILRMANFDNFARSGAEPRAETECAGMREILPEAPATICRAEACVVKRV